MRLLIVLLLLVATWACQTRPSASDSDMNALADRYVRLVLASGQHDPDFVDAYYGPPEWKQEAEAAGKRPLDQLREEVARLETEIAAVPEPAGELERLRREYLLKRTRAMGTRLRVVAGERLPFDEESSLLYDAVAPTHPESYFEERITRLDGLVPGDGPLHARVEAFRQRFVIPRDRLEQVFRAAIDGCRERTAAHVALPDDERFDLEFVTDKPWSGYNWYQGGHHSLIQVNTDLPIFIDRAIDLACHEGYPGHHVYNLMYERHLVRERGWREFTVYALFSPQSLIAEGSANFGIEIAFPGEERVTFERERLFPLAGLDQADASRYYQVLEALEDLSYAGNEAARRYLDGAFTADQAVDWLVRYTLTSPERARQRLRFIDRYRSYVINYNLGKDLVRAYVEGRGGTADRPDVRWRVFTELLSTPRLPSSLKSGT
ncbi:MAG TPA: hypothetical protein VF198_11615 [Vicinamibacterales bacterium]